MQQSFDSSSPFMKPLNSSQESQAKQFVNKKGYLIPVEYKYLNDYDFLPIEPELFREPKDFTNVLFKRMSYHYLDQLGNQEDFLIAKGITEARKPTNSIIDGRNNITNDKINVTEQERNYIKGNGKDGEKYQQKKLDLIETLEQFQFQEQPKFQRPTQNNHIKDNSFLIHENNIYALPQSTKIMNPLRDKLNSTHEMEVILSKLNTTNRPRQLRAQSHDQQRTFTSSRKQQSAYSDYQMSDSFSYNFTNQTKKQKEPLKQYQRDSSPIALPRHQKENLHKSSNELQQIQENQVVFKRDASLLKNNHHKSISSAQSTGDRPNVKRRVQIACVDMVSQSQKNQFHKACKKLDGISSFYDYASQVLEKSKNENNQEEEGVIDKDKEIEQLNIEQKFHELNKLKKLNRKNIRQIKQEQHSQLLKLVDFEQTKIKLDQGSQSIYSITPTFDRSTATPNNYILPQFDQARRVRDNDSQQKQASKQTSQPSPRDIYIQTRIQQITPRKQIPLDQMENSSLLQKQNHSNWNVRRQRLKFDTLQLKRNSDLKEDGEEKGEDQETRLERKTKLYKYFEGDKGEKLIVNKPKKFLKFQKTLIQSRKHKVSVSLFDILKQQQEQEAIEFMRAKFGRPIKQLYDFLKKCIRLKICITEIIEEKVFTSKPYERPGSYIFFKMVRMNKLDSVKNQIDECKWRIFDYDHLEMTALHIAIDKGYKEMALYFINQNSDLEAEDIDNKTPLWIALKNQQFEIAKCLLMNKANPWANDNYKLYELITDPDMRSSLRLSRQLYFISRCLPYNKRNHFWETTKNSILNPTLEIFNQEVEEGD